MERKNVISIFIILSGCLFLYILGISFYSIHRDVKEISEKAEGEFGKKGIFALMAMIEAEDSTFTEKNRAIWALGQIGDSRALPLLKKLVNREPDNGPNTRTTQISQNELKKAIKWCEGSFSLTKWMHKKYRKGGRI